MIGGSEQNGVVPGLQEDTALPPGVQPRGQRDWLLAGYGAPPASTTADAAERGHLTREGGPKKSYDDWRVAAERAREMTVQGMGQLRFYRCRVCKRYHVGNIEPYDVQAARTEEIGALGAAMMRALQAQGQQGQKGAAVSEPVAELVQPAKQERRGERELRERYSAIARRVASGQSVAAACEAMGVNKAQYYKALAAERERLQAQGPVLAPPAVEPEPTPQSPVVSEPVVPKERKARELTGTSIQAVKYRTNPVMRFFSIFYQRVKARVKREPEKWAGVPLPRMRRGKPVLRPEHLLLLKPEEREGLFGRQTAQRSVA